MFRGRTACCSGPCGNLTSCCDGEPRTHDAGEAFSVLGTSGDVGNEKEGIRDYKQTPPNASNGTVRRSPEIWKLWPFWFQAQEASEGLASSEDKCLGFRCTYLLGALRCCSQA